MTISYFTSEMVDAIIKNMISDNRQVSSMQMLEGFKEDALGAERLFLPKDEYAHVMSELNSHLSDEDRQSRLISKPIGDYVYLIINRGFDEYTIIGKYPIDTEIDDV